MAENYKGYTMEARKEEQEKKNAPEPDVQSIYSDKDRIYLSKLQVKLEKSKTMREQLFPEWNNKSYLQIYDENEKIANTYLEPKKNTDDVILSAGTIEAKLDALLSHISNLDLSPEVRVFDKQNNRLHELGIAFEDIIFKTEEKDGGDEAGDEEKKILRQRELLKQGTVFVQEEWLKLFETKKRLTENYNGQFKDWDKWSEALECVFEGPSRNLLFGPNVYMGNITEFFMEKQPHVFALIHEDFNVAAGKYGKFENWKYVKPGMPQQVTLVGSTENFNSIFSNAWRLTEVKENQVEIILYQDKPNDEFQIIINGVLMLPIKFPLSAVSPGGNYNIAKQCFRVINHKFAYGKSFVSSGSVKEISAIIDEMLRLFVLKTRKSFTPAYINTSGRVISPKVLSPGRISMGIPPDALKAIGNESQGVTANEFSVFKELQDRIDKSTVSNQFTGQQGGPGTTATEVLELQRQSKLTLGLVILSCSLLEKKLSYLRLWNILENWFKPTGSRVLEFGGTKQIANTYRTSNRSTNIEGEGFGERMVIPTDGPLPSPEVIRALEVNEEDEKGFPIRKMYLSPQELKKAKLTWYISINPKEKESSAKDKLLFREELTDMLSLIQLGSRPNVDALEEDFARIWKKSRGRVFQKVTVGPEISAPSGAEGASRVLGRANTSGAPIAPSGVGQAG